MKCRHCASSLTNVFLDLGFAPPSNAYLSEAALCAPETSFPLKLFVCNQCGLVQTEDYASADQLFSGDYAYFSSVSRSWLAHAANYADMITGQLKLNDRSLVIEVAANDGYLLRNFVAAGIPCLGIEPTASTAEAAEQLGIPVLREFFGADVARQLAEQGRRADLIIGNNVYAHVPDINDFTTGLRLALKPGGTITLEFPHLMRLVEEVQFDTVYHEHFSYLSLGTVATIFRAAGLRICDVEELPTHGGSLRIYGCHADDPRQDTDAPARILAAEVHSGIDQFGGEAYRSFQARANVVKDGLLTFLIEQKRAGKKVAAYGAAAKGNTLLNYAGVKPDLLPFVCDAAPSKQGKFLPGSHIPIVSPDALAEGKPDIVLILPWNIAGEVAGQLAFIRNWGGQFAVAVPAIHVF
ncbi:class I SAM-dependent methyltransferase [Cupriavidus consociatus]|uniref:class I SAM-dependent methyltransferase n=1 Tax=Cupriavidus consociatus TaxID=2821357 RepID=UPI001AEB494A|nr:MULTISPECIES: class I SAM-dependent methyltransferase [unclassified Cupriavidus]MBP0621444.1 class I SAM-dependent methyltransferase [Cupriavidus sp. LEh25]MDK2658117.1 class I SAM-dependent methyltransferase [Cupriavidus sp. LEh21]